MRQGRQSRFEAREARRGDAGRNKARPGGARRGEAGRDDVGQGEERRGEARCAPSGQTLHRPSKALVWREATSRMLGK